MNELWNTEIKRMIRESATMILFYYDNGMGDILDCAKRARNESTLGGHSWEMVQDIVLEELHARI